jgi:hypothetical protein
MKVTILQASKLLGVDVVTVREMLKEDGCPIGMAYKPEGRTRWTYVIYPKAFEWLVGRIGEQDEKDNDDSRIADDDECR